MNSISNDFVTIEYKNYQEKCAKYCLETFNREPELYKALLNGKTSIHSDELPIINLLDKKEETEKNNKKYINMAIMKMNGVTDKYYPFDNVSTKNIYNYMIEFIFLNPSDTWLEVIGASLAYDYYKMTKDFSYIKKHLYGDGLNKEDIGKMCSYKIMNCYDDLLREKISDDIETLTEEDFIMDDFNGIMAILCKVGDNLKSEANEMDKMINTPELYEKLKSYQMPRIDYKEREKLVRGALAYIDPTYKLLEEYLELEKEDRIYEEDATENSRSSYFYRYGDDYGIKLYTQNNLEDVITLVHELSHFHYSKINKNSNKLFNEYNSIYYEKKAAEYLKKEGYSDDDIEYASFFRKNSNLFELLYIIPSLYTAKNNIGKEQKDYDISIIKKMLNQANTEVSEDHTNKEEIEGYLQSGLANIKMNLLKPIDNGSKLLIYEIGTYFAEYAMNNLKHEEALTILDRIATNYYDLYDVLKMHGIVPETIGLDDKPKQKVKNTNEQTSNDKE